MAVAANGNHLSQERLLAHQAYPEYFEQAEIEKCRLLGSIALKGSVEIQTEHVNDTTLLAAAQLAALGDRQSQMVVQTNVGTDVAERLFKAGHQTEVTLSCIDGAISQNGRRLVDIHKNTLQHTVLNTVMRKRTEAELRNALLFELFASNGVLDDYDVVVFSPTPTDAQTRRDYNFFTDTDSLSIQFLTTRKDKLVLETAMVAGKTSPSASRQDLQIVSQLTARPGNIDAGDETDFLNRVVLVPKVANSGVHTLVKQYDELAGNTFYGQLKPRQNYESYRTVCKERTKSFENTVEQITGQLISEAHTFKTPFDAILRLDELSERYCLKRAFGDRTIDARVFGAQAAGHIEEARFFIQNGDIAAAAMAIQDAKKTASSSSCPFLKGSSAQNTSPGDNEANNADSKEEPEGKKWMNCPFCKARVFDDPCAAKLSCWDCNATVSGGKVTDTGNGGKKVRAQRAKEKELEAQGKREAQVAEMVDQAFEEQGVISFENEAKEQHEQMLGSISTV